MASTSTVLAGGVFPHSFAASTAPSALTSAVPFNRLPSSPARSPQPALTLPESSAAANVFTPLAFAEFAMAAPEPESRFTSSSTLAPLVMAWSAWVRWVWAEPSALVMHALRPSLVIACWRSGRSWVSQRTDDLLSGSRTPTSHLAFAVFTDAPAVDTPAPMIWKPTSAT